jgi:hypothetical protein
MQGVTTLTYNGVTLTNVLTRRFQQDAVYDQSGTDLVYHRFTIVAQGVIADHTSAVYSSYPNMPSVLPDSTIQHHAIRSLLLKPRGEFRMEIGGGNEILRASPLTGRVPLLSSDTGTASQQYDVNNGPKPKRCEITQIAGSTALRVEFEIEICKVECDADGNATGNTTGILSNRWSCIDTVDQNFYTTRTFTGRLECVGNFNPHTLRNWVVPRLTIGFRRQSMTFRVSEDARILEYQIADREVAFAPPRPATSWRYTHREVGSDRMGRVRSSIDIYLAGPRDVDKARLIEIATAVFEARLMNGDIEKNATIIEHIELVDSYGDNENSVNLSATVSRVPAAEGRVGTTFGMIAANLGKPIDKNDLEGVVDDYNSNLSIGGYNDEPIFVSGPIPIVGAFAAYLQTPCDENHRMIGAAEITSGDEDEDTGSEPDVNAYVVKDIEENLPDKLSEAHRRDPYTVWKVDSKYQTDDHRAALPIAGLTAGVGVSGGGSSLSVVNLAPPAARRIIRIEAQRVGRQPVLPKPKRSYRFLGGIARRLRYAVTPQDPRKTADNKYIFTVIAEIEYALSVVPKDEDKLPIGNNPWEDPAFADRKAEDLIGNEEP